MKPRSRGSVPADQACRQTPPTLIDTFHTPFPSGGIVVIASEARVRITLNIALRRQGFSVRLASSVEEALDLHQRHPKDFDAVVLDADMPGVDLRQALQALRVVNPHVRTCLLAGADYCKGEELVRLSPGRVFRKPLELDEVVQGLRSVLTQSSERSATLSEPPALRPVPAESPGSEKRAFVRYLCQFSASGQPPGHLGKGWQGRLRDISACGTSLLLDRRFEPGALLIIELMDSDGDPSHSFVARVVRVSRENSGQWSLGCTFARPLSQDDVRSLLS